MMRKSVTITARLKPHIKQALVEVAEKQHRGLANTLEVMIREYCKRNGVKVPDD